MTQAAWSGPTTSTAADGTFAIDTLPPGSYSLVARVSGYQLSTPVPVTVSAGQNESGINVTLTAAAITDAAPPAVPATAAANLPEDWFHLANVDPMKYPGSFVTATNELSAILQACTIPDPVLEEDASIAISALYQRSLDRENAWIAFRDGAVKSPGFVAFLNNPDQFDVMNQIISALRRQQAEHPSSANGINLAKVADILEMGVQEAVFVVGDYNMGNAGDALTHTGTPQLGNAIVTAELYRQVLNNLPVSFLLSDPSLYFYGDYFALKHSLLRRNNCRTMRPPR